MSEDRNILNFIRNLCANGESGRLEILAGAVQGELSFAEGKLVDAAGKLYASATSTLLLIEQ